MAVFSRYPVVLESDDSPMPVKTALALINQELDAILTDEDGDYDPYTRFAVAWFEQHGHGRGKSGDADNLARAKDVGVNAMKDFFAATAGEAWLRRRGDLPEGWDPALGDRPTVWEATQHLTRRHEAEGVDGAAALLGRLPGTVADACRALAYRLYQACEQRKAPQEALPYNALVADWPEIQKRKAAFVATGGVSREPELPGMVA